MAALARIRLSSAEELERIEPLWNSLREHYESLEDSPGDVYGREESWRRRRQTYVELLREGGTVIALELHGELVAYAALRPVDTSPVFAWSERAMMIETFVVSARHRGEGLGSRLLEAVREDARERGDDELQLMVLDGNDAALDFYRANGFRTYCLLLSDAMPGADA